MKRLVAACLFAIAAGLTILASTAPAQFGAIKTIGRNCYPGGNDRFTKILLHMTGSNGGTTFTDTNAGGAAHTWTAVGTAITSTDTLVSSAFGPTAMRGNVGGGSIQTPDDADFALGTSDLTIDFWMNRSATTGVDGLWSQGGAAPSGASTAGTWTSGNLFSATLSDGSNFQVLTSTTTVTDSNWRHYAYQRRGNNVDLFLNGVREATGSFSASVPNSTDEFAVGRGLANANPFNGYIDEFRLSVGIARYGAVTSYTPPNAPYCP